MNSYDFGNGMDKFNENFLSWNRSYPDQASQVFLKATDDVRIDASFDPFYSKI